MFCNGIEKKFNTDYLSQDISLHSGIPKQYYQLKDKVFKDWEIPPWELFIFKDRLLGEGSFSKVYLAKWRETFVVAKVINEEFIKIKKEIVLREFDIMTKIHHPNIVQFLGYIDNPLIIVLEYIPKGNLMDKIPVLRKREKISIMKDILKGIGYIHNRKPYSLIHRDIKPTNILLTNSKVGKIADFGLSKFYSIEKINSYENLSQLDETDENEDEHKSKSKSKNKNKSSYVELTENVGTERYMAPETKIENGSYDNKIDIYACGILLYEMFENKRYVPGIKMSWYWCPKNIKNIIVEKMLCDDPNMRFDALNILRIMDKMNI